MNDLDRLCGHSRGDDRLHPVRAVDHQAAALGELMTFGEALTELIAERIKDGSDPAYVRDCLKEWVSRLESV